MSNIKSIAWSNGNWGSPNDLAISINDRGLNLGDGIFETICILNGEPQLLEAHLHRWTTSAHLLGMATPPPITWLTPLIQEGVNRSNLNNSNGALRINWSRGNNSERGIIISQKNKHSKEHTFWLEINHSEPCFSPISTMISQHERRNANSRLSHIKTFAYGQAIQAKEEALLAGYDEALLLSTSDELCCGTTSNLLIRRNGEWITPPLASGCLPGIMRQRSLSLGMAKEKKISPKPHINDQWLLINSLCCRSITQVNKQKLKKINNTKKIWDSLLEESCI